MISRLLWAALASVVLGGCSAFGSDSRYQLSETTKPIEYPQGVQSLELPPLYPIPEIQIKEEAFYNIDTDGFVVPRPEPMSAERQQAKVKIQKVGERRWILAEASTSQIWPLAQNFLMQYNLGADTSEPKSGLVVTDWVEFKDDPDKRHQFRIRIEKGVRDETTEIHAIERARGKNEKSSGDWAEHSQNPPREEWVLMELANSLAGNIGDKAASLLGQSVGGQVKAELFMDGEEPAILLRLDQQRAWATLAHAVNSGQFKLWDEDSERGIFFVQHQSNAKKRNWFMRLLLGKGEHLNQRPFSLNEALKHLDDSAQARQMFGDLPGVQFNKALDNAKGELVILSQRGSDMIVKIRDISGNTLPLRENKRYLAAIRRHLI